MADETAKFNAGKFEGTSILDAPTEALENGLHCAADGGPFCRAVNREFERRASIWKEREERRWRRRRRPPVFDKSLQ